MRNIVFKSLYAENFKSYESLMFDFNTNNLKLLIGPNGSGKTTIIDALVWALYGYTTKKTKDVVRKKVGKNTYVKLEFSIDNIDYIIDDYYKHTKYQDNKSLKYVESGIIIVSGREDVHKEISKIIMPIDAFLNCILFSQFIKKDKRFIEATDSNKKIILEQIIGLSVYDDYYEKIKNKNNELSNELDLLNSNIPLIKESIQSLEDYKIEKQKELQQSDINKNIQIKTNESKIIEYENYISTYKDNIELYNKDKVIYDSLKEEYNKLTYDKNELINRYKKETDILSKELLYRKNICINDIENNSKLFSNTIKYKLLEYDTEEEKIKHEKERILSDIESWYNNKSLELHRKIINDIDGLNKESQTIKINIDNLDNKIKDKRSNINIEKNNLNLLNIELNKPTPICYACNQTLDKLGIEYINKQKEIIENKIFTLTEELNILLQSIENNNSILLSINNKINEINIKNDGIKEELIRRYNIKLDSIRNYKTEELIKLSNEKSNLSNQLYEHEKSISSEKNKKISEIENKYNLKIKELANKYDYNKSIINGNIVTLNKTLEEMSNKLKEMDVINNNINKYTILLNNISENIQRIQTEYNNSFNTITDTINKFNKDKLLKENKLHSIYVNIDRINKEIEMCNVLKKGFSNSGIKAILLDEAIPILNEKAIELSSYTNIKVYFDSTSTTKSGNVRNDFCINVQNITNHNDVKNELSGGESRILDIITMMSLRHLLEVMHNTRINILLLDEILDTLDQENIQIILNIFKQMTNQYTVILISHILYDNIEADETFILQ